MSTVLSVTALPSGRVLQLVTADSFKEWVIGLSGKPIPLDGMLFRFPGPSLFNYFQTAQMLAPIDIAFLDAHGHVLGLYQNAQPGPKFIDTNRVRGYRSVIETRAGLLSSLRPTAFRW